MQEIDQDRFPFITGLLYAETEYYGIVINHDNTIITLYDLDKMPTVETKQQFIRLGEIWWWESNRQMPIDVFLHYEMKPFQPYLSTFIMKDIEHMFGPMTTMQTMLKKRIKRRGIQLVKRTR
jgi:hypothetical protein